MARRRFFVPPVRNAQTELEGDDAKHLTQVLRVEAGEVYEISDNQTVYVAEVTLARKAHVVFRVLETLPTPEPLIHSPSSSH
jgi:16S rRNA U1498 N3-methylase RsmE